MATTKTKKKPKYKGACQNYRDRQRLEWLCTAMENEIKKNGKDRRCPYHVYAQKYKDSWMAKNNCSLYDVLARVPDSTGRNFHDRLSDLYYESKKGLPYLIRRVRKYALGQDVK